MIKKKVGLFLILVSTVIMMSACAAMGSSDRSDSQALAEMPASEPYYEEAMVEAEESASEKAGFAAGIDDSSNAVERMVIYNADMEIAVENPEEAMQSIIKMAEDSGGFVVNSNLSRSTYDEFGTLPEAYLTVRVPAGRLDSIMEAIKDLTPEPDEDVIYENVSGQDVTAEYTDLESRLRNLEAAEAALVELMEEAKDPEDVLNVFDELTYYRGEIEVVKGRMNYLEESAALSAISVRIIAKRSLQPIEIVGWQPEGTVKDAVEAFIKAGQFIVDAAIWLGIFCLPFVIPLGIAVYFLVKVIRKRRMKKKAEKAEVVNKEEPEAEA